MKHKYSAILALLFLSSIFSSSALAASDPLRAEFTTTLQFSSEAVNSPKRIPPILFSGKILIDGERVRIDVVNNITQEPSIALLDTAKGTAALLYPDNLNGENMSLGNDFQTSYLDLFRDFALGSKLGAIKGWELATNKTDSGATEYLYTGQSKRTVSFLINQESGERLLTITSPKMVVAIKLSSIETDISPGKDQFAIPADFSMRNSETNLADFLPSL